MGSIIPHIAVVKSSMPAAIEQSLSIQHNLLGLACGNTSSSRPHKEKDVATMTEQQLNPVFHSLARPAPPKTQGLPIVGALPALIKGQLDFFLEARARYGDIYTLDLGFSQMVVLNQPRHAEHVLRDNSRNYTKGGAMWDSVRTALGNGLVV